MPRLHTLLVGFLLPLAGTMLVVEASRAEPPARKPPAHYPILRPLPDMLPPVPGYPVPFTRAPLPSGSPDGPRAPLHTLDLRPIDCPHLGKLTHPSKELAPLRPVEGKIIVEPARRAASDHYPALDRSGKSWDVPSRSAPPPPKATPTTSPSSSSTSSTSAPTAPRAPEAKRAPEAPKAPDASTPLPPQNLRRDPEPKIRNGAAALKES